MCEKEIPADLLEKARKAAKKHAEQIFTPEAIASAIEADKGGILIGKLNMKKCEGCCEMVDQYRYGEVVYNEYMGMNLCEACWNSLDYMDGYWEE